MEQHQKLFARTDKETGRRQRLYEHVRETAHFLQQACEKVGLGNMGYFLGLVHDLFKATARWQQHRMSGDGSVKVLHAPYAARWIWHRYSSRSKAYSHRLTAQILAVAV